jgi:hypothetical protein
MAVFGILSSGMVYSTMAEGSQGYKMTKPDNTEDDALQVFLDQFCLSLHFKCQSEQEALEYAKNLADHIQANYISKEAVRGAIHQARRDVWSRQKRSEGQAAASDMAYAIRQRLNLEERTPDA